MSDARARELDAAFLEMVAAWAGGGASLDEAAFDAHARAVLAYQIEHNTPYRRFAASLGYGPHRMPSNWREIPAVPASAFKDATLACFDPLRAELVFHTSGTTAGRPGTHYVERARLYDAALVAGFDRFMLGDGARLRYLNLVPDPREHKHSSLGYMMAYVSVLRGDGKAQYFLTEAGVDAQAFARAIEAACAAKRAVCIAGTAFAFVALLEALDVAERTFALPVGSRVMETGGFKGRTKAVERDDLYRALSARLGVAQEAIVAEYGMTELLSQYYDDPASRTSDVRVKVAPPWLRPLVVDANGREMAAGEVGFLRHVDLANRGSVVAIDTEDRGYRSGTGIVLLGRDADAPPRGCSLDAEDIELANSRSASSQRQVRAFS